MQDVVIVGGGMAGYSLAIALGRQGVQVTLVERETQLPRLVKGELLQAYGVELARDLGILPLLLEAGGHQLTHYRRWNMQHEVNFPLDEREPACALAIEQDHYLQALQDAATATPNVRVMLGVRATGLLHRETGVAGITTQAQDGSAGELSARLVVGADGRQSHVRKWGDLPATSRTDHFVCSGRIRLETPPGPACYWAQFAFGEAAVGVPFANGTMRVYLEFGKEHLPEFQADAPRAWEQRLPRLPFVQGPFAVLPETVQTCGALDLVCQQVVADGLVLAGDAAGVLDPIGGQGLELAVHDAWLLAQLIPHWLQGPHMRQEVLRTYEVMRQDLFHRCRAMSQQLGDSVRASGVMLWVTGRIYRRIGVNNRFRDYLRTDVYGQPRALTPGVLLRQAVGWPLPAGAAPTMAELLAQEQAALHAHRGTPA